MRAFWLSLACCLAFLIPWALAGCGGGGGVAPPPTGGAVFTFAWPTSVTAPPRAGFIEAALSLTVAIGGQAKTINRPTDRVAFTGLRTGSRSFTATAFAGADGTGNAVGEAKGALSIVANATASQALGSSDASIDHLEMVYLAADLTLDKGQVLQLLAYAVDAAGTTVLVVPGSITWHSSDPVVASVDTTGKVTALTAGTADIEASYQSRLTVQATITVQEPAATSYFPLGLGDSWYYRNPATSATLSAHVTGTKVVNGVLTMEVTTTYSSGDWVRSYFCAASGLIGFHAEDLHLASEGEVEYDTYSPPIKYVMPPSTGGLPNQQSLRTEPGNITRPIVASTETTLAGALTVNGHTYQNVYRVSQHLAWQLNPSIYSDLTLWLAPGIGIIREDFQESGEAPEHWELVNATVAGVRYP